MVANDDLGAFAEGMIGLKEAWKVTQNRLVIDRLTSSETLSWTATLCLPIVRIREPDQFRRQKQQPAKRWSCSIR